MEAGVIRLMRISGVLLAGSLALAACGIEPGEMTGAAPPEAVEYDAMPGDAVRQQEAFTGADRVQEPGGAGAGQGEPLVLLAYRYAMGLEAPAEAIADLHGRHASACREAGPQACQIISAQVNDPDGPRASAMLELRAAPDWLDAFRAGLPGETEDAGGRILSDTTSVEDLTARIVDAEARLAARTTLRDRLQALLETREGDLGELLQVERELARVQEQLDSQASVLAALRQRVDTSTLSLRYQARRDFVEPGQFNPITAALRDVGDVFAESVGALILLIAALAPWLVVGVPVLWLVIRSIRAMLRRRRQGAS